MRKRFLQYKNWEYGQMGKMTNGETFREGYVSKPIHVGDVISFIKQDGTMDSGIVVEADGQFGVMGYVGAGLRAFRQIDIIITHDLLTEEIAKKLNGFTIREAKKMTVKEIEKQLGYPVEIVEG